MGDFVVLITLFVQLLSLLFGLQCNALAASQTFAQPTPVVRAHIFIHGTYLPGLIFVDPKATFKHKIDPKSPYLQALKTARNKGLFSRSHILLD